jgi:general stress protein 26
MSQHSSVEALLNVAEQTIKAAGCASLITLDEFGYPSSRALAAFPPDAKFSRVVIGTHPDSRKNLHVLREPRVALSYVDNANRGYLTLIGRAHIEADSEEKTTYWVDRFSAFFPEGPGSSDYQLMIVVPERLELRSFGLKVAEEPTRWRPVILAKDKAGDWRQTH